MEVFVTVPRSARLRSAQTGVSVGGARVAGTAAVIEGDAFRDWLRSEGADGRRCLVVCERRRQVDECRLRVLAVVALRL